MPQCPACDLVAVVDRDRQRALSAAEELQVEALTIIATCSARSTAVSITVPDAEHFPVARDFLSHGVHVLLEKRSPTIWTAGGFADRDRPRTPARSAGRSHRAVFLGLFAVSRHIDRLLFVQSDRIAQFDPRALNTDVVLDLMIHDIDIIMALAASPVEAVDAVGAPVLSSREDIANSRMHFANGCVANVTASRVGQKTERRLRIFQQDGLLVVDFMQGRLVRIVRGGDGMPVRAC